MNKKYQSSQPINHIKLVKNFNNRKYSFRNVYPKISKTKFIKATKTLKIISIFILFSININFLYLITNRKINFVFDKCYLSPDESNLKIIHLIITRFMIEFWPHHNFTNKIYDEDYILNGIHMMKKYLFPSLDNQSCKKFIWILKLGNKANLTYIKSMLNFKNLFEKKIIFEKDIKHYIKNISKGYDILITSRIDYDDRIYYDAINDVRKAINIHKPMVLYGYNRGVSYYESFDTYFEIYKNNTEKGFFSIFVSLIVVIKKVNDTYNIFDLGSHMGVRKKLLESYKSFGINELNYEPAIVDTGDMKFVWVRQNYSGQFPSYSFNYFNKNYKKYKINLNKFYGK